MEISETLAENQRLNDRIDEAHKRLVSINDLNMRRLGAELHDGPAQLISLALLRLDALRPAATAETAGNLVDFERVQGALTEALTEIRDMSAGVTLPQLDTMARMRCCNSPCETMNADPAPRSPWNWPCAGSPHAPQGLPLPYCARRPQQCLPPRWRLWPKDCHYVYKQRPGTRGERHGRRLVRRAADRRAPRHLGHAGPRDVDGRHVRHSVPRGRGHKTRGELRSLEAEVGELGAGRPMIERIRVAVVDDHPIFREGVAFTIRSSQAFEIVAEGASADDAIRIAKELLPDVILLDVSMPGGGIEAARVISSACPVVKVIMLTVSEQEEDVTQALEAGANGYILKGTSGTDLISTLQSVSRGESYVSPGLAARLLAVSMRNVRQQTRPAEQVDLTKREEQILGSWPAGSRTRKSRTRSPSPRRR